MLARLASASILMPLVLASIWFGRETLALLVAAACTVGVVEVSRLFERAGWRPAWPISLMGAIVITIAPLAPGSHVGALALALLVLGPGLYFLAADLPAQRALPDWGLTILTGLFVGWPLAQANALRMADDQVLVQGFVVERGVVLLIVAATATWISDSGAYLVGRAVGRRPFFAHLSPRKTAEGAAAALVLPVIPTLVFAPVLGWPLVFAIVLGLSCGAAAIAGDLLESGLKRLVGAKDAGVIVPGHGGLMDRIDGQIMVLVTLALMTGYIWP